MSRRDKFYQVVCDALEAEGWIITHKEYVFDADPQLETDLGAERLIVAERRLEKIAVEIKSFLLESQAAELEKAVGQYGLYRKLLEIQEPERKLYLAVPVHAYEGIFARQVDQLAVEIFELELLVYDIAQEEPLLWIKR
ncbi:MAG: element excision factor XisH family protein [Caldilineaceae bacterium]